MCWGMAQVLWSPELKNVYLDLMDSDGSELSLLKASFFAPPGERRSFADITEVGLTNYMYIHTTHTCTLTDSLTHTHTCAHTHTHTHTHTRYFA